MSKHVDRNYRIKFVMCLNENTNISSPNYNKYYLPRWSNFMKSIMSRRISNYSNSKTASFLELPLLRKIVNKELKTEVIAPFLVNYDEELTRMMLEVAPFFDSSPDDLKCHILVIFGVTFEKLEEYLQNKETYI